MTTQTLPSYVIQLSGGRLWKNSGANDAAVFQSRENANQTLAGLPASLRQGAKVLGIQQGPASHNRSVGGYWLAENFDA